MRFSLGLLAATTALAVAGASDAATVEVRNAVARVVVIPEARNDIKVEIVRPNGALPLTVRTLGDRTTIDGDLDRRISDCRSAGDRSWVQVRGLGKVGWADMPQVVLHTPRDVKVEMGGAVFGSVGRSASLSLGNSGCGDWTIANVEGAARISQAGSGDTQVGTTGMLKIRVAGSGNVAASDVRGGLEVAIAGSGSAGVRSIAGPLIITVAGSGDVNVASGKASEMKVSVAGSGDIDFGGVAETLRARVAGSGDVRVNAVTGEISKSIMGSGSVRVGR